MNRDPNSALFPAGDSHAEEDLWQRHGAERGVWTEPMLNALERGQEGTKWFSLIDKVRSVGTLGMAWEKVQSNAGACGVDGISVEFFAKDSPNRLPAVNEHPKKNTCVPQAIRRVYNIPHEPLMRLVRARIADGKVLDLIEAFLKQKIEENGIQTEPERGSPQGGIICQHWRRKRGWLSPLRSGCPLLANIYLDPLDWLLAELGYRSARYARSCASASSRRRGGRTEGASPPS